MKGQGFEHGTPGGASYHGCQCGPCQQALYLHKKRWRRDVANGVPRSLDGVGTKRRLRALVAVGWSQKWLADELGVTVQAVNQLLRSDRRVIATTAARVSALYEKCWQGPPPPRTAFEARAQTVSRKIAARDGWAPPMAWDDKLIDDPAAKPEGVGWNGHHLPATKEALWRIALGESVESVAQDLGVKADSILRRARLDGLAS